MIADIAPAGVRLSSLLEDHPSLRPGGRRPAGRAALALARLSRTVAPSPSRSDERGFRVIWNLGTL
jgi:hypothetical protein